MKIDQYFCRAMTTNVQYIIAILLIQGRLRSPIFVTIRSISRTILSQYLPAQNDAATTLLLTDKTIAVPVKK